MSIKFSYTHHHSDFGGGLELDLRGIRVSAEHEWNFEDLILTVSKLR
jgi:hypothetical protein